MRLKKNHPVLSVSILLLVSVVSLHAQSSVLSEGVWFKVTIPKTGVYQLDYNQLRSAGMDVDKIDPRTLKIYGNPGGMLPQANAEPRPYDLIENAIVVEGETDGVFNSSDVVLFYAQGADKQSFNQQRAIFHYEHNLYADKNFVFVTAGGAAGKRVQQAPDVLATVEVSEFQDVTHHELTLSNILKSGREWYGERFENGTEKIIKTDIEGIVPGSTLKLVSDVVAYSLAGTTFSLTLNGNTVGNQTVQQVPNSQYGLKARHKRDTFLLTADNVGATTRTTQEVTYRFAKNGTSSAYGHLDFFTLTTTRTLAVYGDQTSFRSLQSVQQASSLFKIERTSTNTRVWEVTDPTAIQRHTLQVQGSSGTFAASTPFLKEFVAFSRALPIESISKISNQNLHGMAAVTMLIVTDAELKDEAQRLANHRSAFSGMNVQVVVNEEIYNEFSSGRPDVSAIRDLARSLKQRYPQEFKYLLLFGKGSYDYKNALADNVNRVLTYESRNSISPLETFSSDDFFGLLEDGEGEWRECFSCNATLDIGVGRLPIKRLEQATFVVDKIIRYDANEDMAGNWQTSIAFVADDGDFNTHQAQADNLATYLETQANSVFKATKIYVDAYSQISRPAGQIAPEVNTAIKNSFEQGALVINYTGHGNEYQWANEKILDELMVLGTQNERLPFLVTATCEFGRHDDPLVTSVAEVALLREKHGVVGLVTTARPVNSSTNFDLNQAFYEAFLAKPNGVFQTMGEIFRLTKNNSATGVSNRNFSLLGDPSMRLAFPESAIVVEAITTDEQSDTLRALSKVTLQGFVANLSGNVDETFDGTVALAVYDKAASLKTLGNESPPFSYKQWSSLLFKGEATVEAGRFEFSFIVPKNIAYSVGNGRMNLFAKSATKTAAGVSTIKVGGSASDPIPDTTPPRVEVFMNDSTFVSGGLVSSDVNLVVRLSDASGITISSFGIGNDLTGVLNDEKVYELNEYYTADVDDYTKGTVVYPLSELSPGKHRITVKAWDTYNNSAENYIDFVVDDGSAMLIESFGNYPNPFDQESTLFFTHNTAGEDLQAEMVLYGPQGTKVLQQTYSVPNSNFRVDLGNVTRNDLPAGIYLAHLFLRSETSGKQAKSSAKLVIVN